MTTEKLTTEERINLRQIGLSICPRCEKVVEMLSFEEAVNVYRTDMQDIAWLAEKGDLHRLHDRLGRVMICGISLFDVIDKRRTRLLDRSFEIATRSQT